MAWDIYEGPFSVVAVCYDEDHDEAVDSRVVADNIGDVDRALVVMEEVDVPPGWRVEVWDVDENMLDGCCRDAASSEERQAVRREMLES